jgi:hypothetical protein
MRLRKLASLLSAEATSWAKLLRGLDATNGPDRYVLEGIALRGVGGEPLLTTGYAAIRLLEAVGKLDDVLASIGSLWPGRKAWAETERSRHALAQLVPWLVRPSLEDLETTRPIITRLLHELHDVGALAGWENRYEMLTRRRIVWAAAYSARRSTPSLLDVISSSLLLTESSESRSPARRDYSDRDIDMRRLIPAVQGYLHAEGLFTWMTYQADANSDRIHDWHPYQQLFHTVRMEGKAPMISQADIEAVIGELPSRELFSDIMTIVGRLQQAIEGGGYEQVLDVVSEDDGLYGADSVIPNEQPVNIIPGSTPGACHRLVIAFSAAKKRGKVEPLPATLRKVREHLIRCFQRTALVIVLTDSWSPTHFMESRLDFIAHRDHGVVFLPLLVNRRQLVPMALPA